MKNALRMLLCIIPFARAIAQVPSQEAQDLSLDSLLVVKISTASKHWETTSEAPASVTIIPSEDIQKFGFRTLAIVKSHSGFIDVKSEVGKGTTFTVYLPAQTTASADAEVSEDELPSGHGELILVVDDEGPQYSESGATASLAKPHTTREVVALVLGLLASGEASVGPVQKNPDHLAHSSQIESTKPA